MIFKGKWIQPAEFDGKRPLDVFHREREAAHEDLTHPEELKNLHIHFMKKLRLETAYKKITLRVTADDYYKLKINGGFACQGPAPGYFFCYYWNEFDITNHLRVGENTLEFEVYYQGLINRVWNSGDLRCGMICDIIADGDVICSSDESFTYYISRRWPDKRTFGYATQYCETYDATAAEPVPRPVSVNPSPDYTFADSTLSPIKVYEARPITSERLENNMIFCDFGRETTGTIRLIARGKSGSQVDIYFGEETEDTPIRTRWKMRCNCDYHDIWIMGADDDCFEGYDYKAFRYVTVAPSEGVEILDISVAARHSDLRDEDVVLTTDNETLRSVFEICRHGVRCGTQEIFVDCPSREKGQYAGDLTVTGSSYLWLTGDLATYRKALENQMQSAFIDEGIMAVTPGSHMQEIADYSLQFPIIALREYDFSGDKVFLKRCLDASEKILATFEKFADEDGLLDGVTSKWNLVDWPTNLRDGYDFPMTQPIGKGKHNVINAFYVNAVGCVENIRDILGIEGEKKFDRLAAAFNTTFYNEALGLYVDAPGSTHSALHSNVLPLYGGIVPSGREQCIADFIVEKGFRCGVYMTFFLLRSLCRVGRYEDAYNLITSHAECSWYNMVREGATSCFEAWGKNMKGNTSLCHPWASAPITVLIEDICGWKPDGTRGENHAPVGVDVDVRWFNR